MTQKTFSSMLLLWLISTSCMTSLENHAATNPSAATINQGTVLRNGFHPTTTPMKRAKNPRLSEFLADIIDGGLINIVSGLACLLLSIIIGVCLYLAGYVKDTSKDNIVTFLATIFFSYIASLVGTAITYGVFGSLGNRIMGIRVVYKNGEPIGKGTRFLRFLIKGSCFYGFLGWMLGAAAEDSWYNSLFDCVVVEG